jgi:predicted HTH transcriptional regulator
MTPAFLQHDQTGDTARTGSALPELRPYVNDAWIDRETVDEQDGGIDKVVFETEFYQLPAPLFETTDEHTRAVLFSHREFRDMDKADRIRACYLHACLRYVQRDGMTNTTLRKRFGIEEKNSAMVSRVIKDTIAAGLIVCHDETVGNRARKYLPWWAR